MTKNQKTFTYVGVGILLLLLFLRSKKQAKSLEEGAPSEGGAVGGGGGGFGGGGGVIPLPPVYSPPVVAPIVPSGYVVIGNSITPRENLLVNNPNTSIPVSNVPTTRETPTPPPPSATTTQSALARPSVSVKKFTDFDGTQNFQDAIL